MVLLDADQEQGSAPAKVKGESAPLLGQEGFEVQVLANQTHSAKAINDGHPSASHGRDVQALVDFVVVVVQIQACGAVVELVGLGGVAQPAGQYRVHAGREGALVQGQGFIKVEVLFKRFNRSAVFKKEHALKGVGLLDVGRTQDSVPAPFLVDGAFGGVQLRGGHEFLVEESVLLQVYTVLFAVGVVHGAANRLPLLNFVGF